MSVGIGSTIWVFDENRRRYTPGLGGPIYRKHWVPTKIVGETRVSWIVDHFDWKIPKKGHGGVAFSEAELEDFVWAHDNRYQIADAVRRCDARLLRAVAATIGYTKEAG